MYQVAFPGRAYCCIARFLPLQGRLLPLLVCRVRAIFYRPSRGNLARTIMGTALFSASCPHPLDSYCKGIYQYRVPKTNRQFGQFTLGEPNMHRMGRLRVEYSRPLEPDADNAAVGKLSAPQGVRVYAPSGAVVRQPPFSIWGGRASPKESAFPQQKEMNHADTKSANF